MDVERRIRWYQRPFHEYLTNIPGARAIEIAHRRWGKDEVTLTATCELAHKRPASYWHCLPEYEQARKALWTAVNPHTGKRRIDEVFPQPLRASTNEQEMFIRFKNGSTWQLIGSDRYDSLVGAGIAGVVFSEWALANPSAWGFIRPMIEENNGWAAFITTPRGRNHAKAMFDMAKNNKRWFAEISTIHDTGSLTQEQLDEALADYVALYGPDGGQAHFEQEYLCSFEAAIIGAYWGRELARADREGRITSVPYEPLQPVHTAWDLGLGVNLAVWFFQILPGGRINVIDYWQGEHSDSMEQAVEALAAKPYEYGYDWIPHDGLTPEVSNRRTRVEMLASMRRMPRVLPRTSVEDGINGAKVTLARCWFDEKKCEVGLHAMREYRAKWDDEKKVYSNKPEHNWASHAADAFRYLAMAWREIVPEAKPADPFIELMRKPTLSDWTKEMDEDGSE